MAMPFLESGSNATFDLKFWSGVVGAGTIASDAAHPIAGPRSIKCSTSGNTAYLQRDGALSSSVNTDRFSAHFYLSALPAADLDLLDGHFGTLTYKLAAYVQSDGTLKLVSGSTALGTGGSLSATTLTRLTVTANITSTTVYTVKLFKNGAEVISVTNGATLENAGQAGLLSVGLILTSTLDLWFGSVYADDDGSNTDPGGGAANFLVTAKRSVSNGAQNNFDSTNGIGPGSGRRSTRRAWPPRLWTTARRPTSRSRPRQRSTRRTRPARATRATRRASACAAARPPIPSSMSARR